MSDPWQLLRRAGLPLGAPDPEGVAPTEDEIGSAVRIAIASAPSGRSRDALCAFVLAWRRQWPRSFTRAFGAGASSIEAWADAAVTDPNRYIKLSRIAMANLAHIL